MEQVSSAPLQEAEYLTVQEKEIILPVTTQEDSAAAKEKVPVASQRAEVSVSHTANISVRE